MTRLIVEWEEGDQCTYSCTVTVPIIYSGADEFLIALDDAVKEWITLDKKDYNRDELKHLYTIGGYEFNLYDFIYYDDPNSYSLPEVYTIDEYFSCVEEKQK